MKLIKVISFLLIVFCGMFIVGCKDKEVEPTYESNVPSSIKEGEEFILEVKENGNLVSNDLVTVIFEKNLIEITAGTVKALAEGVEHVTVIYNNKTVTSPSKTILLL